jgi:PPE-repeat protein
MDFGALPPEINSARMYSGPGPGPMMAAATAWSGVAAELNSTANSYQRVVSRLSGEEWLGPGSTSMVDAAAPYVLWMNSTGAHAELVANRARSAAAAYEQAYAMTVHPSVIAANRAQLQELVATNVLGQNTAAISAAESQYGEMWAQDAAAMYGYAGHAAVATKIKHFAPPPETTNSSGAATQAAAVSHAGASKTLASTSRALQGLTTPGTTGTTPDATTPASALSSSPLKLSDANSTYSNFIHSANFGARGICAIWRGLSGGMGAAKMAGSAASKAVSGAANAAGGAARAAVGLGSVSGVAGHIGKAGLVGAMSVPPSWAPPAPAATTTGFVSGGTWEAVGAAPQAAATAAPGMPGVPGALGTGRNAGFSAPRYGARITVMPRPPIGG